MSTFAEYLKQAGYVRFRGAVDARVYAFFACPHAHKARWYVHKGLHSFQCAGCKEQCETDDSQGFQLSLLDL